MRKIIEKLKTKNGETIVETLCAILLITITMACFVCGVEVALKMNKTAKTQDTATRTAYSSAEQIRSEKTAPASGKTPQDGKITITIDGKSNDIDVTFSNGDKTSLRSYYLR